MADGLLRDWAELYVVADVHGESGRLAAALDVLDDRPVVLVGDYVDRGPDSRGVLELLTDATSRRDDVVCLRGNHEDGLLTYLEGGLPEVFAAGGGLATARSYGYPGAAEGIVPAGFRTGFPVAHRRFLEGLPLYVETPDLVVSHAGLSPERPHSRARADLLHGDAGRYGGQRTAPFPKTVVCGHYGRPHVGERFISIDLGCGTMPDRPLAVLSWPERTVLTF
jgi:serine/threonine protein phosphatase 1